MVAYLFTGSFIITTFLLQWWQQPSYPLWLWIIVLAPSSLLLALRPQSKFLSIVTLGSAIALATVSRTTHVTTPNTVDFYAGTGNVQIIGEIAEHPDRRPLQTKYVVDVETLTLEDGTTHTGIRGRVLITDRRLWPEFHYGDLVTVEGKLVRPGRIDDFRYDHYLQRYKIYVTIPFATITAHDYPSSIIHHPFRKSLYALKDRFELRINRLLPEPHASLLAGLLVGSRGFLSEDLLDAFNATGLTHIIALSGYNVTIVIGIITGFLIFLPIRVRFFPAVFAIIAFVMMVGAEASVVRAGIMGILGLFAILLGERRSTRLAILWTATLMLLWNPLQLWYDVGFQLSFLALVGITELGSTVKSWIVRVPDLLDFREAMQMTIAAQLVAIPVIALHFDRISLVAPVANGLIAIAVPFAMLFGALAVAVSTISFPFGQILVYPTWGFLQWIIFTAETLAALPFASIDVPFAGPVFVILYYIALTCWFLRHNVAARRSHAADNNGSEAPFHGAAFPTTRRPEDFFSPQATAPAPSLEAPSPAA